MVRVAIHLFIDECIEIDVTVSCNNINYIYCDIQLYMYNIDYTIDI